MVPDLFTGLNLPSHIFAKDFPISVVSNSKEFLNGFRKKRTRSPDDGAIAT